MGNRHSPQRGHYCFFLSNKRSVIDAFQFFGTDRAERNAEFCDTEILVVSLYFYAMRLQNSVFQCFLFPRIEGSYEWQ